MCTNELVVALGPAGVGDGLGDGVVAGVALGEAEAVATGLGVALELADGRGDTFTVASSLVRPRSPMASVASVKPAASTASTSTPVAVATILPTLHRPTDST